MSKDNKAPKETKQARKETKKALPDWMPDIALLREETWPKQKALNFNLFLEENRELFHKAVMTAGSEPGGLAYASEDAVYFTCNSPIAGNGRDAIEFFAQELRDLGWYAVIADSTKSDRVMMGSVFPNPSNTPSIESLCTCSWPHRKGQSTHTHFKECPNVSEEKEGFQVVHPQSESR